MNFLSKEIIKALQVATGRSCANLHEPVFFGDELINLKECIDSTFVSSVGKFVDQFEIDLAEYVGSKYAVAVVNGTAALHIALKLVGVQEGDEVLVPALTFAATANAVKYCNAIPHFVDSDFETLGIDVISLSNYLEGHTFQKSGFCVNRKTGKIIRAIVPMHTFGHPVDLDLLLILSKKFNITLVEDAAESLGSFYKGKHTGTFGKVGILSFNGNKIITAGGGGAILTDDEVIAARAKHLTTTAKVKHPWEFIHDEVAYNYRMPNLNASVGCAQLKSISRILSLKRKLFERYKEAFGGIESVKLFEEPNNCSSNYWLNTLILDPNYATERDLILTDTNEAGFMTRPAWNLLSSLPHFRECPKMELTKSELLVKTIINIPSGPDLLC